MTTTAPVRVTGRSIHAWVTDAPHIDDMRPAKVHVVMGQRRLGPFTFGPWRPVQVTVRGPVPLAGWDVARFRGREPMPAWLEATIAEMVRAWRADR